MKRFYTFIFILIVSVLATMAVLGSALSNNVAKNPNTIVISLPSLYNEDSKNDENDLDDWDFNSEMSLFGSELSSDGEKIIYPGSSNSIEITIENRNDEALDFDIDFSFASNNEELWIPLMCKITRYDGVELTNGYVPVETITDLSDHHTLGALHYAYYEIDWYWPTGEDDNFYGELAMKEELRISSTIHAKTNKSEDTLSTNGVKIEYKKNPIWQIVNVIVGIVLGLGAITTLLKLFSLED